MSGTERICYFFDAALVPYHSLMSATATAISDVEAKVLGSLGLIFFGD